MPPSWNSLYSFKYVNGHPSNTKLGLSTVMAFGVLSHVDTGPPLLLSELTLTTAMRTAVTSVFAAQLLARPDSRVMALIGNGAQSEFQALAFQHLMGIEEVRLFDVDPTASAKLADNLQGSGLKVVVCGSTAEAVKGSDIVTTVTADILNPASVFVEFAPQSRIEGEIQQMPADFAVTELWEVLQGHKAGRRDAQEVTVFDSVGFAREDYSALRFMYHECDRTRPGRAHRPDSRAGRSEEPVRRVAQRRGQHPGRAAPRGLIPPVALTEGLLLSSGAGYCCFQPACRLPCLSSASGLLHHDPASAPVACPGRCRRAWRHTRGIASSPRIAGSADQVAAPARGRCRRASVCWHVSA
ncbi:MAG: L-lysine cyclodeaminase [Pseudomonadota bacterium]|jgi:ornithine cyclodeaminase